MSDCRKIPFDTLEIAEKVLTKAQASAAKGNQRRHERRTYECPDCGRFHLTKFPPPGASR